MRGILIVNTGSPVTKEKEDVKWFIGQMLSDPLVMTVPDWLRPILAKNIIAPLRASRSASRYSLIWNNQSNTSPLLYYTRNLACKIEHATDLPVEIAMRYGEPSVSSAFDKLQNRGVNLHEVIVFPMFPQYAQSSYQTAVDEIGRCFYKKTYSFRLKFIEPFYSDPAYIHALALSLKPYLQSDYDRLVFSFHSLPLSHEEAGCAKGKQFDYVYQIKETIRLVSKELQLDSNKNRLVYSSAMGKNWLKPGLNETIKSFSEKGVKKIIIITPGFPADNLETLYDIDIKAREIFLNNGGKEFFFVPGLNSHDYWVHAVIKMITHRF